MLFQINSNRCAVFELPLEFDLYGVSDGVGGFDQGVELHRQIGRALHAARLRAAGGHGLGHGYFAEFACLRGHIQLLGQGAFERAGLHGFINAVFFEQGVKVATAMGGCGSRYCHICYIFSSCLRCILLGYSLFSC